jgi:hypothetical protein
MTDQQTTETSKFPVKLSFEEAATQLDLVVRTKGEDHIDQGTTFGYVYFKDGGPSCIVGHLLAKHGIEQADLEQYEPPTEDMRRFYGRKRDANKSTGVEKLRRLKIIDVDDTTLEMLSEAQKKNDARLPWRRAFDRAIERAAAFGRTWSRKD